MSHCGLRSEEEDFRTLRNRMLECICEEAMKQKKDPQWFHGIERNVQEAFLNKRLLINISIVTRISTNYGETPGPILQLATSGSIRRVAE
jgi:hypothetical protein